MSDIYKLFTTGQKKLIDEMSKFETTKVGTLRAGNTGIVTPEGEIIGPCMAATYLRYKGIDVKGLDDDGDSGGAAGRELMFEAGRVNEDLWTAVLKQSWAGPILRESEIATHWKTESGVDVTGRPDLVLCESSGTNGKTSIVPKLGLELKQVSSFWTAYEVKFKGQPKYNHLLQAAHYSWQLGVPFELWYTSRSDYHIQSWIASQLPKPGEPNSEFLAYSYYKVNADKSRNKLAKADFEVYAGKKQADPIKVTPFIHGYKIELRDGILHYASAMSPQAIWKPTNITTTAIELYYNAITGLHEVPPEPYVLKADGTKANYKASDYCSLGKLCCKYNEGRNIEEWTDLIKQELVK